jgi:hypothetical protein
MLKHCPTNKNPSRLTCKLQSKPVLGVIAPNANWRLVCRTALNWIPGQTAKHIYIAASTSVFGRCARRRLYHSWAGKRGPQRRGPTKRPRRHIAPPPQQPTAHALLEAL